MTERPSADFDAKEEKPGKVELPSMICICDCSCIMLTYCKDTTLYHENI
jgi:hypothetical protein